MTASENVAFDVIGYCYYLEDGVEENNTLSYNLGAHIHMIGDEPPRGGGQTIPVYVQSRDLVRACCRDYHRLFYCVLFCCTCTECFFLVCCLLNEFVLCFLLQTLPADVTASAFYITNVNNHVIGNSASGGWAGFAFPNLPTPLGAHRDVPLRPSDVLGGNIDGNTAHSTGWWWYHAGKCFEMIYFLLCIVSTIVQKLIQ